MAWARPPGAPEYSSCPLESLEPREDDYITLVDQYGCQAAGVIAGALVPTSVNYFVKTRLPTGVIKRSLCAFIGGYLGYLIKDFRYKQVTERDAILRDYIASHPEDFPKYKRTLYKNEFLPWSPKR